ncbi:hypothetical protein AB1Y20_008160 [Prymnesium parvum]|uniref:Secreted protein n=1 Tax=Prymnesium parvum TaxID=97485 RepID=A0AB34IUM3_PRYPA
MKLMAQRAFLSLVAASTHATIERTETFVREERACALRHEPHGLPRPSFIVPSASLKARAAAPSPFSLSLPEFSSMRMWSCLRRRIVATLPVAPILLVNLHLQLVGQSFLWSWWEPMDNSEPL